MHSLYMLFCSSIVQSCPTLWDLKNCSLPASVHKILLARILEWVAISYSRGFSWPRDWTHISCVFCVGKWILYHLATWKAQCRLLKQLKFDCPRVWHFQGPEPGLDGQVTWVVRAGGGGGREPVGSSSCIPWLPGAVVPLITFPAAPLMCPSMWHKISPRFTVLQYLLAEKM